jgi:phenylpyruvate tautomerase PptA (4-oxalocrotonate tautomerase family)
MAERKTKSLTLPSGATVELKEYISAGEFLDASESSTEISKNELAKRLVQLAVVAVNGSKENVPAALRELPLADYLAISKEVAQLTSADFTSAKASQ